MKNLIFIVSILVCLTLGGCASKKEELIELNRANALNVPAQNENVLTVETIDVDKSAEDASYSQPIVVYICGSVNNPGVYELDGGSRIFDAIEASGGFTSDAYERHLNLAKVITDEQMIYVPSMAEYEQLLQEAEAARSGDAGGSSGSYGLSGDVFGNGLDGAGGGSQDNGTAGGTSGGLVNINTATAEQLMAIPGIGQSKAEKIINFREENGGFKTCEDIMQISGIKEGMYNKIKDKICVK